MTPTIIFFIVLIVATCGLLTEVASLRSLRNEADQVCRDITALMNHPQVSVALAEPEPDGSPVYALITRCPRTDCGAQGAHLVLGLTDTHADRQCVECDHTWKERRSA